MWRGKRAPYAGWSQTYVRKFCTEKLRSASEGAKTSKDQSPRPTQQILAFPSSYSLQMHIQDDWRRMTEKFKSVMLAQKSLNWEMQRLGSWSVYNLERDFGSFADPLTFFFVPHDKRNPPNYRDQPESARQRFAYI